MQSIVYAEYSWNEYFNVYFSTKLNDTTLVT